MVDSWFGTGLGASHYSGYNYLYLANFGYLGRYPIKLNSYIVDYEGCPVWFDIVLLVQASSSICESFDMLSYNFLFTYHKIDCVLKMNILYATFKFVLLRTYNFIYMHQYGVKPNVSAFVH